MKSVLITFLLSAASVSAQDSITVTDEQRKEFKKNQYLLDMNHGGIGITLYKPKFGDIASSDKPWIDVNILSDIFEIKFGLGQTQVRGSVPFGYTGSQYKNTNYFGYHFYTGVNFPLNFLNAGVQNSPVKVFRGHPVIAAGGGYYSLTDEARYWNKKSVQIIYLGINPGYRIRFPFGSIEANLNLRLGMDVGEDSDFFKGLGFNPSVTMRIDALKWRYNSKMVTVQAQQTSISNVQSTTTHTGTRYEANSRIDYYSTTTTGDVHVTNFDMGIQDIGPHFGIGPKVSFMSPKKSPYIPLSKMFGVVAEGRGGPVAMGLTIEGGRIGHGGKLKVKDEEEGKFYRKLDRHETDGTGTINTVNVYTQLGFDISPIFLIPLGITYDKGNATSYLSVVAGFNFGAHFSWGQKFDDPSIRDYYDSELSDNEGLAKDKDIDPSKAKSGYLGGFYMAVEVGAMSFKVTNYRYYGAPFASTTMYGIAYRIPLRTRAQY